MIPTTSLHWNTLDTVLYFLLYVLAHFFLIPLLVRGKVRRGLMTKSRCFCWSSSSSLFLLTQKPLHTPPKYYYKTLQKIQQSCIFCMLHPRYKIIKTCVPKLSIFSLYTINVALFLVKTCDTFCHNWGDFFCTRMDFFYYCLLAFSLSLFGHAKLLEESSR